MARRRADNGALAEIDRLILHQAVTVVALELLRRRVADSTERRLAGDVLTAMIAGELDGVELVRRLEPFGLGDRVAALVLCPARAHHARARARPRWPTRCAPRRSTGSSRPPSAACSRCVPGVPDDELFELAERVVERAADGARAPAAGRAPGASVPAGRAREAFHEARCALEARALSAETTSANGGHERPHQQSRRDLPRPRLLPAAALAAGHRRPAAVLRLAAVGPIESGEGHYGGELMRSLEAFIECNGQWEAAAKRLYCHRHTLRYRIRKIEELTGRDLASARDRIEFWLALRGRETRPVTARTPTTTRTSDVKVGVPTEIKTDEYRVALTPSGVRELADHGHEVVVQAGAGEGSAITDADYVAQGAAILPDADAVFAEAEHDRQGQGAPGRRGRAAASPATRCSPTCTSRPTPSSRAG